MDDANLRKVYLDGANSIMKILPIPTVTLVNDQTYVSIKACVRNYLMSGKEPKRIGNLK